ncbi:hypothetical protein A9Q78_04720 [Methylophaga sp. 41_12_T18]|nr:hypothetical protein A9Q78_04720 [Methylophaga sp. 41_12_T18]
MVFVMLIQQATQAQLGVIKDIPAKLLANLVVGQQVEAVVLTAALAAEVVKLRVADSLLEIKTPIRLTQGQAVKLVVVQSDGKPVLQLLPTVAASSVPQVKPQTLPLVLELGQQLSVEVAKVVSKDRLLLDVQPAKLNVNQQPTPSVTQSKTVLQPLPQLELDISRLKQNFKLNDKLIVEVVSLKPLSLKVKPDLSQRDSMIMEKLRQLLPQQATEKTNLNSLVQAHQAKTLPGPVVKQVQQLLQHVMERPSVAKPIALKQAIQQSGVFLESQLLTKPTAATNDFKANLLRVIAVLETTIANNNQQVTTATKLELKSLPPQIQSALAILTTMPQDLSKLPAQIQTALATLGQTPAQLLSLLTASFNNSAAPSEELKAQIATLSQLINKPALAMDKEQTVQTKVLAAELAVLKGLLKEVEGVHAKLQFNQLSMLKEPDSPTAPNVWLMDLPLKDRDRLDMVQLQLEQQASNDEEESDTWNIQLTLDTRNLGPLQATINMCGENVKVMICAERSASAELLAQHLDILNAGLAKLEVNIHHLSCRCGEVSPLSISALMVKESNSLVDISV